MKKKLFIPIIIFVLGLFAMGLQAQSNTHELKLTKVVTVEEVKQMSNDEVIELLPTHSKTEVNKLLAIKYVKRDNVYKFVRKQIINHIENQ